MKLRIAWIVYDGLEGRSGGTIYDREVVRGLGALGVGVDVAAIRRGGDPSPLVRDLARSRPDIVVGDELCFRELAFVFPRTSFVRRVLLVHHLTCWETELRPRLRARARLSEALALRHADAVVATSETTRRRLTAEGHRGAIAVVVPGADRLPLAAGSARAARPRLLFVGAVIARKRVRELALALEGIDATLRIAGSLAADPRYVRAVEAAAPARALFLGELDDAALAGEIAAADFVVMPSSLEGYGIAATEAARAGTPVIAARTSGLVEALAPCGEGAVFFDDVRDLGAAIRAAIPRRAAMRAALAHVALPTWAAAASGFLDGITRGGERHP